MEFDSSRIHPLILGNTLILTVFFCLIGWYPGYDHDLGFCFPLFVFFLVTSSLLLYLGYRLVEKTKVKDSILYSFCFVIALVISSAIARLVC